MFGLWWTLGVYLSAKTCSESGALTCFRDASHQQSGEYRHWLSDGLLLTVTQEILAVVAANVRAQQERSDSKDRVSRQII
jgi:hypothetical protein